jgi:hypothetical protein
MFSSVTACTVVIIIESHFQADCITVLPKLIKLTKEGFDLVKFSSLRFENSRVNGL